MRRRGGGGRERDRGRGREMEEMVRKRGRGRNEPLKFHTPEQNITVVNCPTNMFGH